MTATPTPLAWYEPGFDHAAARARALGVLGEIIESMDTAGVGEFTSVGIEANYTVRAQIDDATAAGMLAGEWSAGPPNIEDHKGREHHVWEVLLGESALGTLVRIVAVVDATDPAVQR